MKVKIKAEITLSQRPHYQQTLTLDKRNPNFPHKIKLRKGMHSMVKPQMVLYLKTVKMRPTPSTTLIQEIIKHFPDKLLRHLPSSFQIMSTSICRFAHTFSSIPHLIKRQCFLVEGTFIAALPFSPSSSALSKEYSICLHFTKYDFGFVAMLIHFNRSFGCSSSSFHSIQSLLHH